MKLKVYTVYDSKVEAYLPPFFMKNKGEVLRAWETTVNDPQSNMCKFPADFTLFEIGEFDDQSGVVSMYEAKVSYGLALEYKHKPEHPAPLLERIEEEKGN